MNSNEFFHYDYSCNQVCQVPGIRFTGVINKQGKKIAGGFSPQTIPLEKDQSKIEMLMMELALDLSMRREFDNSLGSIKAIVSYRDNVNIITIPHDDKLILVSSEPELDPHKVIQIVRDHLLQNKILEVTSN